MVPMSTDCWPVETGLAACMALLPCSSVRDAVGTPDLRRRFRGRPMSEGHSHERSTSPSSAGNFDPVSSALQPGCHFHVRMISRNEPSLKPDRGSEIALLIPLGARKVAPAPGQDRTALVKYV